MATKHGNRWRADFSYRGKRYRRGGFLSRKHAELWEANKRLELERQEIGLSDKKHEEVKEIFELFLEHKEHYIKKSTLEFYRVIFVNWLNWLQSQGISSTSEFTRSTWKEYSDHKRLLHTKNSRINAEVAAAKRAFNHAIEQEVISENPLRYFKKLPEKKEDVPRYLTIEEVEGIEKIIATDTRKAYLKDVFFVLVRTGMRVGEIMSLTTSNIDLERKRIVLEADKTKSGYTRFIPMSGKMQKLMQRKVEEAQKAGRKLLFTTNRGTALTQAQIFDSLRLVYDKAKEEGIIEDREGLNIHTLRKTYISHMIMQGVDPVRVMAIVGHKDWSTIRKYLALSPKYVQGDGDVLPY